MSTATLDTVTEKVEIEIVGENVDKILGEGVRTDPQLWHCPVRLSYGSFNGNGHKIKIITRKCFQKPDGNKISVYHLSFPEECSQDIIKILEDANKIADPSRIKYHVLRGNFQRGQIGEIKETGYN